GLQRFREQVDQFQPDLITVCYGWNDCPDSCGQPDKDYRIPSRPVIALQRLLLRYDCYRLLSTLLQRRAPPTKLSNVARVPLADYIDNMQSFATLAAAHGIKVVFMTRPHRDSVEQMLTYKDTFRWLVPSYNDALREFARRTSSLLLDTNEHF